MKENIIQKTFVENVIDSHLLDEELLNLIIPIGNFKPEKIIEIYATDYKYRMLDALKSNFESVWMVVGDEKFQSLAFDYCKFYPSMEFDLNLYGQHFPKFLSENEIINDIPFLHELALFELEFWSTFHSPSIPINLQNIDQNQILNATFRLNQNTKLFKCEYNIYPLYCYKNKTLDDFFEQYNEEDVFKPSYYMLYKKDFRVFCQTLSKSQFDFFTELNTKNSIMDVINNPPDITKDETIEIFKLISNDLINNLNLS